MTPTPSQRPPVPRHVGRGGEDQLRFLYGDLGLDQKTIASLLGSSIATIEQVVRDAQLKRHAPTYGPFNRRMFDEFGRRLQVEWRLPDVEPAQRWNSTRKVMAEALKVRGIGDGSLNNVIDAFLADAPFLRSAAEARLTEKRLRFLVGDLKKNRVFVREILDAPIEAVDHALKKFHVEQGSGVLNYLDRQPLYRELAHRL